MGTTPSWFGCMVQLLFICQSITGSHTASVDWPAVLDKYMVQLLFICLSITGSHGEQSPVPILDKYMVQ